MITCARLWLDCAEMRGDAPAFRRKQRGIWQALSWRDWHEQSSRLAAGLVALGLQPGEGVLVMCGNRFEWPVIDMAVQGLGAFVFGLHPCATPEQVRAAVAVAPRYVVAESADELAVLYRSGVLEAAVAVVVIEGANAQDVFPRVLQFAELVATPSLTFDFVLQSATALSPATAELDVLVQGGVRFWTPDELLRALEQRTSWAASRSLSFVSYASVAERSHQLACALAGGVVHFPENAYTIVNDMCELRPDVVVAPQRFWQERRDEVDSRVAAAGWPGRLIFRWATKSSRPGPVRRFLTRNVRQSIGLASARISIPAGAPELQGLAGWYQALGVKFLPASEPLRPVQDPSLSPAPSLLASS